jgi:hypothetical protein
MKNPVYIYYIIKLAQVAKAIAPPAPG